MNIIEAIVLGIIQGLTEFLPVSSSGHLVLFEKIFGVSNDGITFELILHIGTLFAVLIIFYKDIIDCIKHPFSKKTITVIIATIVTFGIYIIFDDFFTSLYETGNLLGVSFLLTALILYLSKNVNSQKRDLDNIKWRDSFIMGLFQGLAIIPGVSRSGSTISAGLLSGLSKDACIRISFLMSIPAILGGALFDGIKIIKDPSLFTLPIFETVMGCFFAFVSGLFAIKFLIRVINKRGIYFFSYYVGALGLLVLLDQFVFHVFL